MPRPKKRNVARVLRKNRRAPRRRVWRGVKELTQVLYAMYEAQQKKETGNGN